MSEEGLDQSSLESAAELLDLSVKFMLLLILGILFSFAALLIQRQQFCLSTAGEDTSSCPDPSPIRKLAGVLTLLCAGFFFFLALESWKSAPKDDPKQQTLSRVDLWASLLALAASFLRLWVLEGNGDSPSPVGAESGALLSQAMDNILPA